MESPPAAAAPVLRPPPAWAAPLGRAARFARHAPDRLLHPWRRAAALRRVRAAAPGAVLFVCEGNIYRSPYAAALLERALASAGVRVSSAGLIGPGRASPAAAVESARRRGVDLSAHLSSLVSAERVREAAVVVVMEPRQAAVLRAVFGPGVRALVLGDLDPDPIATRAVRDPWGQRVQVLEETYDRVERCVAALAGALVRG